jgi:hypothetical protein
MSGDPHGRKLAAARKQEEAERRLEVARAEFQLADAKWRDEVQAADYSGAIEAAEARLARAKAAS